MKYLSLLTAAALAGKTLAAPQPVVDKRDFDFEALVKLIASSFPANETIVAGCDLITNTQQDIADAVGLEITADDTECNDVTLLFARGTCDPGNLGAITGPPFIAALRDSLGDSTLSVQGVDYPATVEGYLNDDPSGGQLMADMVTEVQSSCPDTKLVMAGYSQGGYVVHNAATALEGTDAMSKVSSVVIFGDPDSDEAVAGIDPANVKVFCNETDNICEAGDIILLSHLIYALNAVEAADFVTGKLGL